MSFCQIIKDKTGLYYKPISELRLIDGVVNIQRWMLSNTAENPSGYRTFNVNHES